MSKMYTKKPIPIEAVQWLGVNINEMQHFTRYRVKVVENQRLKVKTLEGAIYAEVGDFIIKGIRGEVYPIKPDIFAETYDEVEPHHI